MQNKNDLTKSTWLNNLKVGGGATPVESILDYMFIQIVPFENKGNIMLLHPDHDATLAERPGNAYAVHGHPQYKSFLNRPNMPSRPGWFPIGKLTNLTHLRLENNQLSGQIPEEVCDLIVSNNLYINEILLGNSLLTNTCE